MRIFEVMSEDVATIEPTATTAAARQLMRSKGINHLVVMRDRELVGIVSSRDLPDDATRGRRSRTAVKDVMHGRVVTTGPKTLLTKAANLMAGRSVGSLVVTARGKVLGIVTVTDLLRLVGRGAGRQPKRAARPTLRTTVPHRKQHRAGGAW